MRKPIPESFPRDPSLSPSQGAAINYSARDVEGSFVVGLVDSALGDRFATCLQLTDDLVRYYRRERLEKPGRAHDLLVEHVKARMEPIRAELGVSPAEAAWVIGHFIAVLEENPAGNDDDDDWELY